MFFGSNGVIYSNPDNIISHLNSKILLSDHSNEFIERLNFINGKISVLENLLRDTGEVVELNSHTKRISSSAKSKGFISLLVYDLGGQDRFWPFYDNYFSMADNVLFFRDFENSILSEVELQQLRGLYEKVLIDKARLKSGCSLLNEGDILKGLNISYALSKSDVGYLNNNFSIDLSPDSVASFERHNLVMPVTSLYSWGNSGVIPCMSSLILKILTPGKYAYNLCLAGSGSAGKTSFVNTFLNLITNNHLFNSMLDNVIAEFSDEDINRLYNNDYHDLSSDDLLLLKKLKENFSSNTNLVTILSVGPQGVPLAVNPELFYYHDNNFRSCFVNSQGEIVYYLKPEYNLRVGDIKSFKLFNADNSEFVFNDSEGNPLSCIEGKHYGHILNWLYESGLSPVYDLDSISRIAQFMKPSAWGLESSYDGFFPESPDYLMANCPNLNDNLGINKKYMFELIIKSGASLKEINAELIKRGIN